MANKVIRLTEYELCSLVKTLVLETTESILFEDKWNGNGDMWRLLKPDRVPHILYHVSKKSNRDSILASGLWAQVGAEYENWWNYEGPNGESPDSEEIPEGVFLTDSPHFWYDRIDTEEDYDVWSVSTDMLDRDCLFVDPGLKNKGSYFYTSDIPPSAIRLNK